MPEEPKPGTGMNGPPVIGRPPIIPPIPILLGPVITSLSPSGAVVNGPAFTLAVNGARFVNGSVVLWNQSSRTTAFVSPTQLTAAIPASDIAATASGQLPPAAVVTVTNPGGMTSNAVTFPIIPDINDIISVLNTIQTMTADQFPAQQPALAQAVNSLKTWVTIQQATVSNLSNQVSDLQTQNANLSSQVGNLNAQVAQQQATITQLQSQLAAAKNQQASPLDVARSLKGVLDQIQTEAREAGGVQATLTNMNVQIKALVNVQPATATAPPQAVLVFPDPTALPDPNALSTVSLSFSAIPNLKAAVAGAGGTPGAAAAGGARPVSQPPASPPKAETLTAPSPEQKASESIARRIFDKIRGLGKDRPESGS